MSAKPLLLASLLALGTTVDAAAQVKGTLQRFDRSKVWLN